MSRQSRMRNSAQKAKDEAQRSAAIWRRELAKAKDATSRATFQRGVDRNEAAARDAQRTLDRLR